MKDTVLANDAFTRLCRAREMLREVQDRPLTIDEVAREAAMSPFHFIRQFSALFGDTPHQFRIEARLDRAKRLLALGDHSVNRRLPGGRIFESGQLQRSFRAPGRNAAIRLQAPRSLDGRDARSAAEGTVLTVNASSNRGRH